MKITHFLLLTAVISCVSTQVYAEEFKTKSGAVYQGKLMDSDNQTVFIETTSGIINVPKNDLVQLPTGVDAPKKGVALKPAWGKKEPPVPVVHSATPTPPGAALAQAQKAFAADRAADSPPGSKANTPDGKIYGMDIMALQKQAAQAQDPEEKEMFQKAAMLEARHQLMQKQAKDNEGMLEKVKDNPLAKWALGMSNETAAKANLRKIANAIAMFETDKNKTPQSMQDLITAGFLDGEFNGVVTSYKFDLVPQKEDCVVHAVPADLSAGLSHFTLNSKTGKIESAK